VGFRRTAKAELIPAQPVQNPSRSLPPYQRLGIAAIGMKAACLASYTACRIYRGMALHCTHFSAHRKPGDLPLWSVHRIPSGRQMCSPSGLRGCDRRWGRALEKTLSWSGGVPIEALISGRNQRWLVSARSLTSKTRSGCAVRLRLRVGRVNSARGARQFLLLA
jgi:hypothetical protein